MPSNILTVLLIMAVSILKLPADNEVKHLTPRGDYSRKSFFVKTKDELRISEATGKVMLNTGIQILDELIQKNSISNIKPVFINNNRNTELYYKLGMNRIYLLQTEQDEIHGLLDAVSAIDASGDVEFSELNFIGHSAGVRMGSSESTDNMPSDEMFYKQWYLMNTGLVSASGGGTPKVGADINMLKAWDIETGSDSVIVAILDSGIRDEHPDLRQRIWINTEEIPGNNYDDDRNGYVDDTKGWDFAYDDRRPSDGFGHGTNIATVVGASTDNLIGFAGVDQKCKLMNCKNLNSDNNGEYSWWSESIKYAVDNGADIINMSEGGDDPSRVLKSAIDYALESGVMVVAAMMNKGDGRDYYPAVYDGVLAVGATDTDDKRCRRFSWGGGSCWGDHISVVAPGNKIYGLDYEDDNNFEVYWSGTSQSTAIVSGLAALLLAQDRSRTHYDIRRIIESTARDRAGDPYEDVPGWDPYHGYGRIDCYLALSYDRGDAEVMKKIFEEPEENSPKTKPGQESNEEKPTESKTPLPSKPR